MEKEENVIVLDTDDAAAKLTTITGWVSRTGRFYYKDERLARYDGCTHKKCECGNLMSKNYTKCDACISKMKMDRYNSLPLGTWDGESPVCDYFGDKYFFDGIEEIVDYLEDENISPEDLHLVLCKPNYLGELTSEYWDGILPEEGSFPKELDDKINEFNKFITTQPPISYSPSNVRIDIEQEILKATA